MRREVDSVSDRYIDKLYKIIPAEITGAYIAASSLLAGVDPKWYGVLLGAFGGFLTLLVPAYLSKLQNVKDRKQIFVSMISFPIWAANTSALWIQDNYGIIAEVLALILIGWVLLTPILVGGVGAQNSSQ